MKIIFKKFSLLCLIFVFATTTFAAGFAFAQPTDKGKEKLKNTVTDDVYLPAADQPVIENEAENGSGIYEENHPSMHYSGTSKELHGSHYSGGTARRINPNSSVEFTFTGTSITWIGTVDKNYGDAHVYIDGQLVDSPSLHSSKEIHQQIIFEAALDYGTYTIKIEPAGNSGLGNNGNPHINLDAFIVFAEPPTAPTGLTAQVETNVVLLTWDAHSRSNLAGYHVYRFDPENDSWIHMNDTLIIDTVYVDMNVFEGITYSYAVTAVDTKEYESIYSDLVSVDIPKASIITRVEETDSRVLYSGPWANSTNSLFSKGSIKLTGQAGASATFTFNGHGIRVIVLTSPYYGLVDVYLNDQLVGEINLYSESTKYQQTVFEKLNLPSGTNTIKLVNKRELGHINGLGRNMNLDAFDVFQVNEPEPIKEDPIIIPPEDFAITRVEETASTVLYSGTWSSASNSQFSASSIKLSGQENASIEHTFTGHGIRFLSVTSPYYGLVDVYINGQLIAEANLYSDSTKYQQVVFEKRDLPSGTHTIKLVNKREFGHPNGLGRNIGLDAFDVFHEPDPELIEEDPVNPPKDSVITRVEETNSSVLFAGSWSNASSNLFSAGEIKLNGQAGASVEHTFTGHGIRLLALTSPYYGLVDVYINGQLVGEANLYSSSTKYQQTVFEKLDLHSSTHTIKLVNKRVLGHPDGLGRNSNLDAFEVFHESDSIEEDPSIPPESSITTRVEETLSSVVYSGSWSSASNNLFSGGSIMLSGQAGASIEHTFTGHGIRILALTSPYYGLADVYINGNLIAEVNLYSSSSKYQQVVFEKLNLPSGTHTIKLVNKRQLGHPDGLGRNTNLDAFEVIHQ